MPHPTVATQLDRLMALINIAKMVKQQTDANPHPEPEYEPMDHDATTAGSGGNEK